LSPFKIQNLINLLVFFCNKDVREDKNLSFEALKSEAYENYSQFTMKMKKQKEYAVYLIENKIPQMHTIENTSLDHIWHAFRLNIVDNVQRILKYANSLPGFDKILKEDLTTLVQENIFLIQLFNLTRLYMNNDSYALLPGDIVFSKYWIKRCFGEQNMNKLFECFEIISSTEFTEHELSLLYPFLLTKTGKISFNTPAHRNRKINYSYTIFRKDFGES
jgi:hypothetical protein